MGSSANHTCSGSRSFAVGVHCALQVARPAHVCGQSSPANTAGAVHVFSSSVRWSALAPWQHRRLCRIVLLLVRQAFGRQRSWPRLARQPPHSLLERVLVRRGTFWPGGALVLTFLGGCGSGQRPQSLLLALPTASSTSTSPLSWARTARAFGWPRSSHRGGSGRSCSQQCTSRRLRATQRPSERGCKSRAVGRIHSRPLN